MVVLIKIFIKAMYNLAFYFMGHPGFTHKVFHEYTYRIRKKTATFFTP